MKTVTLQKRYGFSLTEVTIALGIIGFCALAVMGLLPVAVQTHRGGHDQTQATQILNSFLNSYLTASTNASGTYELSYPFNFISPTDTAGSNNFSVNGTTNITTNSPMRYRLTYNNSPPPASGYGGRVFATVSWPVASASQSSAPNSVSATIYYNLPSN